MPILRALLTLAMGLLLFGCSVFDVTHSRAELKLLPPSQSPPSVLLKQTLSVQSLDATAKDHAQKILVILSIDQQRVRLLGMLPTGQQLLKLNYDGSVLEEEQLAVVDLPSRDILAIVQFALWPMYSVLSNYSPEQRWQLEQGQDIRRLIYANQLVLTIGYTATAIVVDNHRDGYQVRIQTFEKKYL